MKITINSVQTLFVIARNWAQKKPPLLGVVNYSDHYDLQKLHSHHYYCISFCTFDEISKQQYSMKFRLAIKGLFKIFRISKKRDRKIASIVISILLGIGLFWWIWRYIDSGLLGSHINALFGTDNGGKADFLRFLATVVAGILAYFALRYNAKRTKALDKQNEIAEKGKIDDRFKNAIEHLGSDSPTIVLGGIYSMHQIARDHPDYRKTVFEILCSYIREKTASQKLLLEMTVVEEKNFKTPITIQTCIDLLFKYEEKEEYIYKGLVANLQGIRCPKAKFFRAHLEGANLSGAHLQRADLNNAHLEDANLNDANLAWADLFLSDLTDSLHYNTIFTGAIMEVVFGITPNETDIF